MSLGNRGGRKGGGRRGVPKRRPEVDLREGGRRWGHLLLLTEGGGSKNE